MNTYKRFKEMTDDRELSVKIDPATGTCGVKGIIDGVEVRAQFDPENKGLYAVSIWKFEDFAYLMDCPDVTSENPPENLKGGEEQ